MNTPPDEILDTTFDSYIVYRQAYKVPCVLHFEPSLDTLSFTARRHKLNKDFS